MPLTLLAPDIVEADLDGQTVPEVTLVNVLKPFPLEWEAQAKFLTMPNATSMLAW